MAPSIVILDYGSGNLRSAERALLRTGATVRVSGDPRDAATADGVVVPGVGAFAACMAGVTAIDAGPMLAERIAADRPVLGICVGMQVLFEFGDEHGVVTPGLGLLPGGVTRLVADRLPHMGWNTVTAPAGSTLLRGIDPGERFYFVHSYAAHADAGLATDDTRVAMTIHGEPFVAAVERGPLTATQFHPEKSGAVGAALLANWVHAVERSR